MEKQSKTPSGEDLIRLLEKIDRQTLAKVYTQAITIMQAKIQENDEPFR